MMLFLENMKLALSAIRINKMRSFLTMLGMIIGISSVISIVSIGDTMRSVIADQYESIGSGLALVWINSSDGYYSDAEMFTMDDVEKIAETFKNDIDYISARASGSTSIITGRKNVKLNLTGVKKGYTDVQKVKILKGRMINETDDLGEKKTIVLEEKTAMEVFGKLDVVGQSIKTVTSKGTSSETEAMTIVGVYQNTDSAIMKLMMGGGGTGMAYVPESYLIGPDDWIWQTAFYVSADTDIPTFENKIRGYISRLKNKSVENIVYYSAQQEMQTMDSMMAGLAAAVGAIAAISLVVGGIGIMNIMLVSVTERTREIGIRKALGARTKDILLQFLIESAIISAVGGIIGTILGTGVVAIGGLAFGIAVVIKPSVVLLAVAFSAVVGIFFGLYPAKKAASADPITALRYE